MALVRINGERFLGGVQNNPVEEAVVMLSSVSGGGAERWISTFSPTGASHEMSEGTALVWSAGRIDIELPVDTAGMYVIAVSLRDAAGTYAVDYDIVDTIVPGTPPATDPIVTDATSPAAGTVRLTGTNLDAAGSWFRLIDDNDFTQYYFPPGHAQEANNPAGATVTVNGPTEVDIFDPQLAGLDITYIQTYADDGNYLHEWYGSTGIIGEPLTYPTLTGFCSPSADTVRIEGTNFLNATAGAVGSTVLRGTAAFLGGPSAVHDFIDGSPDGYGWSLITHTDTVIELHNASFEPTDVVHGVAFHSADYEGMYYYEPWGDPSPYSATIDGSGCP